MKKLTTTFCLTIAVLLGSVGVSWSADFDKGKAAYKRGDYATALLEWTPLAEQGYPDAQFKLGLMYKHGAGVPKDNKEAMKWFKLAAEQRYSDAKLLIAAEKGDKNAAFRLGGMYSGTLGGGDDFPEDRGEARRYWKIAAEQGHSGAQRIMNISVPWWKPWELYGWWRFW